MAAGDIVPVPGAHFEETLASASLDVLRAMIREFAQRMMDADVEVACNAGYGEVTPDWVNSRNGYRRRECDTRAGTVELAIPKLRQGSYFPGFLEHRRRAGRALASVVATSYLLGARIRALPWPQVPAGTVTRDTGHGRTETRTLKAAHVSFLDFPGAGQAIKITRRRKDTATGRTHPRDRLRHRQPDQRAPPRPTWPAWSASTGTSRLITIWDTTFSEDTAANRTGSGPANLATIRAAVIAAIKDADYLHVPEGRRDHTTPAETLRLHCLDQTEMGHSRNTGALTLTLTPGQRIGRRHR